MSVWEPSGGGHPHPYQVLETHFLRKTQPKQSHLPCATLPVLRPFTTSPAWLRAPASSFLVPPGDDLSRGPHSRRWDDLQTPLSCSPDEGASGGAGGHDPNTVLSLWLADA